MATEVDRARRLFTLEEYERMIGAAVFGSDDRLELIEGKIVEKSRISDEHAACVDTLTRLFVLGVGDRAIVRVQGPVGLPPRSRPEPDLLLLQLRSYRRGPARTQDVLLVIEVADTSLRYDRTVKLAMYARSGVTDYWVVDPDAETVDVCREPTSGDYRSVQRFGRDRVIAPLTFPDVAISVADLFV